MSNCSPDTANRDLSQLEEYGVLERTGKGKGTKYTLKELERKIEVPAENSAEASEENGG